MEQQYAQPDSVFNSAFRVQVEIETEQQQTRRTLCGRCSRPITPVSYCMCSSFLPTKLTTNTKIWIMQHPLERKRTRLKQTAWYAVQNFAQCELLVHRDFNKLPNFLNAVSQRTVLLFPTETSVSLSTYLQSLPATDNQAAEEQGSRSINSRLSGSHVKNLVILDGTWKQAKALYRWNEALFSSETVSCCHLENVKGMFTVRRPPTRHRKQNCYVSTYEAIVLAMSLIEHFSQETIEVLLKPIELANCQWQSNIPKVLQTPKAAR